MGGVVGKQSVFCDESGGVDDGEGEKAGGQPGEYWEADCQHGEKMSGGYRFLWRRRDERRRRARETGERR